MSDSTVANSAPPAHEKTTPPDASGGRRRFAVPNSAALLVFLVLEVIYFSSQSPFFFSWDNWVNILTAMSVVGVVSCGMTLLLVAGQFDLSVGSGVAFAGLMLALTAPEHGLVVGVIAALLTGVLIGAVNGFIVTVVGVNALITTLGTLAIFRGLNLVMGDGQNVAIDGIGWGIERPFLDVPVTVWVFVVTVLVCGLVLTFTVFGRSLYAIGANPVAARLVGLRVRSCLFVTFVLSGLLVAVGALMNTSLVGSTSGETGRGLELAAITAVILGGTSLAGGQGSIIGTVLGLLIVGVLSNGLTLTRVDPEWQQVATGALLILAVSFDRFRQNVLSTT